MIAAVDFVQYLASFYVFHQNVGHDKVIDAPAGVVFAGMEAIAPPGILDLGGMQLAEGVFESVGQEAREGVPLLVGEAGIQVVGRWVLEVDFVMGDVQVPGIDHRLLFLESLQIGEQILFVAHAEIHPLEPITSVRDIRTDEIKTFEFQRDQSSFFIIFPIIHPIMDGKGLNAGEYGDAGIAFPYLGNGPIRGITFRHEREGQMLVFAELAFLDDDHIGVERRKGFREPFPEDRADAVYVKGYNLHKYLKSGSILKDKARNM